MLYRIKINKKPLPMVARIDAQSVRNRAGATGQTGFDGDKLTEGCKRFLIVDTVGHLLWADTRPANVHDNQAGVLLWEWAEPLNPLPDDLAFLIVSQLPTNGVGSLRHFLAG